jgi:ABC-type bacteriocin/lantibiotic exporter with double-glycine peptidase domain
MQRLPLPATSLLGRIIATVLTLVIGVGLFMFSMIVFAVLLVVALVFGTYLWWRTRGLRRQLREQIAQSGGHPDTMTRTNAPNHTATVIEGEYVRLDETGRELPRD